jgi:hypothetical protein
MLRKVLGSFGLLLFLGGVAVGLSLLGSSLYARLLDYEDIQHGNIGDEPPPCNWQVSVARRVMAENEAQAVLVSVANTTPDACRSTLALRAPSFDMSPNKEEQVLIVPPGQEGSVAWIITPRRTGAYELAVADVLNTRSLGITVTNVLGLTAVQAQLLATLGSLFGPMLTVPWWFDKWRQRQLKPPQRPASAPAAAPPTPKPTTADEDAA